MAYKIYLSPSDQYGNLYAYGNTNEAVQCNLISKACQKALERCGFEVKQNENMYTAVKESNSWKADLHVPIHTNAFDGKVSGTRIFAYALSGEGYKAAQAIYNVLAPITPGKSENIKAAPTLYEVKNTNAPCVYVEVDFHDNPTAAKWIIEHTEDIAEAICKGICNHFKVTYKTPTTKTVKYAVQFGNFATRAEAETFCKQLGGYNIVEVKA